MKHLRLTIFTLSLCLPQCVSASVILSEVQIEGAAASDEFIELYNSGDAPVNLSGWSLRKKTVTDAVIKALPGTSIKTFGSADSIPAHGYFLWSNSGGLFKDLADVTTTGSLSDNNSLALYSKDSVLQDSLTWGTGHALPYSPALFANPDEKESLVRDLANLTWSEKNSPTPTNSQGETFTYPDETPDVPAPDPDAPIAKVHINEVFPNPKAKDDVGEFIELYNYGTETVDLSGWEVHDATATGKYVFPSGTSLTAGSYLVITDADFTFSLNNTTETLTLFDKEKHLVHQVSYTKTKEDVSLNLVGQGNGSVLRGARKPTPGAANSDNTDPITRERVPEKGYRDFLIEFRARGQDNDGDTLKYTWDFGDGHKSYKETTSHKYLKSGRYTVTLTTDDGIDTTNETFAIRIEKYEAPNIRITALLPNPDGNDSDHEWIEIENRGKKSVNLLDFSIATGTTAKKMTNHPIREDFTIAGKSVKRLTRGESLFTLGNTRGRVELRAPDGSVIQTLKYKFDKSLGDDVILKKEKGKGLISVSAPAPIITSPEVASDIEAKVSSEQNVSVPETPEVLPAVMVAPTEATPPSEPSKEETPPPLDSETPSEAMLSPLVSALETFSRSNLLQVLIAEQKIIPAGWRDDLNAMLNRFALALF